jgi:6-phosphogluconolactonase/glucosamine-6-phosphate isomerase/deaminase
LLQGGAILLYEKLANFLMINAGQYSNIVVSKIQSLINLGIISVGTDGHLAFFADFIAVFNKYLKVKTLRRCNITYV